MNLGFMIQPFSASDNAICKLNQTEGASVSQNLINWFEGLHSLLIERRMRQIIFKMKADTRLPESGIKLVSNFVFNNEKFSPDPNGLPPTFNGTFLGKEMTKAYGISVSFDENGELHGLVELMVQKNENFDMKYGFQLSGLTTIQAFFTHGVINGPVVVSSFIGY